MSAARIVAVVALLAVGVAVALLARGSGGGHRVTVVVPDAAGVRAGFEVRAAGRPVGEVEKVELTRDRQARVVLAIEDEGWPIHGDGRMSVRWGGTAKFSDRYIALDRGSRGRAVPEDGTFPRSRFSAPVEFDDVFKTFDRRTRRNLERTLDRSGPALFAAGDDLRRAIDEAPPAVEQARGVFEELTADPASLHLLVRSTDRLVGAIARSNPDVGRLVAGTGTTLATVGSRSDQLRTALAEVPHTLARTRRTLARADPTLRAVGDLSTRLAPGVRAAKRLTGPLASALRTLDDVGPDTRATLASTRRAAPDLSRLLTRLGPLLPELESTGRQLARQLECVRPYAPEIAGLGSTWGAGFLARGDGKDKVARSKFGIMTIEPNVSPISAGDLSRLIPGLTSSLVRPPGQLIGQPWFQPRCGAGPDAIDPDKDPEIKHLDLLSKVFPGPKQPEPIP